MWILRYTYCLFRGHAFIDIVTDRSPYQYCLHCGKVEDSSGHTGESRSRSLRSGMVHTP